MAGVIPSEEAWTQVSQAVRYYQGNREERAGQSPSLASPSGSQHARCTGTTADALGNYPALITSYSAQWGQWMDFGAVKLKMPNGGAPTVGTNYDVQPAGITPAGDALYVVSGAEGAGKGWGTSRLIGSAVYFKNISPIVPDRPVQIQPWGASSPGLPGAPQAGPDQLGLLGVDTSLLTIPAAGVYLLDLSTWTFSTSAGGNPLSIAVTQSQVTVGDYITVGAYRSLSQSVYECPGMYVERQGLFTAASLMRSTGYRSFAAGDILRVYASITNVTVDGVGAGQTNFTTVLTITRMG